MDMHKRFVFAVALLLAGAAVVLPAVAGSETAPTPITAENLGGGIYGETHAWTPSRVTVGEGGAVTLSNPTAVLHGVHWIAPPATPSCTGVPVGTTEADSGKEWSGTCTFTTPGTYYFYCTVHGAAMSGTVTVAGSSTPGTPPPVSPASGPPAAGGEPGSASAPGSSAPGSPLLGGATRALKLASAQHGRFVRGSLAVSQAGARGRLELDLLANAASLGGAGHAPRVQVGKLVRTSLAPGTLTFSIPLSARAKRALSRKGHLALTLRLVLRPTSGSAVTASRALLLRG
jgi:plastocyanin